LDDPLIWVRAVHFAATISVCGVVIFHAFVGAPAFRAASNEPMTRAVRRGLARIAWASLVLVVLSNAAWLVVQSVQMSERPPSALWSEGVLGTVLLDTDFGRVWLARSVLMGLLAAALPAYFTGEPSSPWRRGAALASAGALVAALAFAGHAAAGEGIESVVQQGADALHLIAAASWVGSLLPLAVLLGAAANDRGESALAIARAATLRFSTLGIASVATVLASGIVNTWELAGSAPALFGTGYGRLLLAKIALFLAMLSVAAVNRFRLTPRLQGADDSARCDALRQLRANSLIEAGLGVVILVIVGALGTLPPGNEQIGYDAAPYDRFGAGTGTPGIFTRTEPRLVRLVKYKVIQSSPPNARLVVCG
jgi:copper resistance protein D